MKKKRRPEIMKPSLKLLTPHEKKIVATVGEQVRLMWQDLYARNRWKPQPEKNPKKPLA